MEPLMQGLDASIAILGRLDALLWIGITLVVGVCALLMALMPVRRAPAR